MTDDAPKRLAPGMRGWTRAWESVAHRCGDAECRDAETGETWQYMGSDDAAFDHCFRHRNYRGRGRTYEYVQIEPGDFDVEINK